VDIWRRQLLPFALEGYGMSHLHFRFSAESGHKAERSTRLLCADIVAKVFLG
jgi:hypothetical protein